MDLIKSTKLSKSSTDQNQNFIPANISQYVQAIKGILFDEYSSPSSESIRYFIRRLFPTIKSEKKVDQFRPILKEAFEQFVDDHVNDQLQLHDYANVERTPESHPNSVDGYGRVIKQDIFIKNEEFEKFFIVDVDSLTS